MFDPKQAGRGFERHQGERVVLSDLAIVAPQGPQLLAGEVTGVEDQGWRRGGGPGDPPRPEIMTIYPKSEKSTKITETQQNHPKFRKTDNTKK